ncbi:MAG: universal stress protein [Smithellaceae bacterium]|nr:universal stress protein [Syntrophaceae bacterium]MDD4240675.1 universal stress protein [Smithellaceae bacterium]NLX52818.1 universal stress protein [Deltaproteobacteria bacterium]
MKEFRNLLYAINLDDERPSSMIFALECARLFKSRLHVVYVNDPQAGYRHPTDREDAIALKVRQAVPAALLEDVEIVYAAARGNAAEEIVKYAEAQDIDLLIVGHKHRSKLYSSMFDSTDVNIIDTALRPVLVIPEK